MPVGGCPPSVNRTLLFPRPPRPPLPPLPPSRPLFPRWKRLPPPHPPRPPLILLVFLRAEIRCLRDVVIFVARTADCKASTICSKSLHSTVDVCTLAIEAMSVGFVLLILVSNLRTRVAGFGAI